MDEKVPVPTAPVTSRPDAEGGSAGDPAGDPAFYDNEPQRLKSGVR